MAEIRLSCFYRRFDRSLESSRPPQRVIRLAVCQGPVQFIDAASAAEKGTGRKFSRLTQTKTEADMQFFDIILFALIAIFLILRLRSVLGSRDGHKGKPDDYRPMGRRSRRDVPKSRSQTNGDGDDNVVQLPDKRATAHPNAPMDVPHGEDETAEDTMDEDEDFGYEGALAEGIKEICAVDPSFNPKEFLDGAGAAFEMILGAYAAGDVKTLKSLLNSEVYSGFAHAIAEREAADQTLQETLVGISEAALVEAYMDGRDATVTVKFVSEQISALMDADGAVIEGDPVKVVPATDFWTFSRNTKSRNPNWTLVGTGTLV